MRPGGRVARREEMNAEEENNVEKDRPWRGAKPPPAIQRFFGSLPAARVTREAGWWLGGAKVGSGWTRRVARVRTVADDPTNYHQY